MPQTAEEYSRRNENVAGHNIAISTYKIGDTYHAKAEIDVPGAGARIAQVSGPSKEQVEAEVLEQVRRLLKK